MLRKLKMRYIFLIMWVIVTAVVVNILSYDPFYQSYIAIKGIEKIPKNLKPWQGYDIKLEENVYDILETKAIIHRQYLYEKGNVFLSLVYYPETKVDFHSPEGCLAGIGIEIKKGIKIINFLHQGKTVEFYVNTLIRENQYSKQLIYYFYKAGDFLGKSLLEIRFNLAKRKLIGLPKSSALIRVSTPLINEESADKILVEFLSKLYPHIMENL